MKLTSTENSSIFELAKLRPVASLFLSSLFREGKKR